MKFKFLIALSFLLFRTQTYSVDAIVGFNQTLIGVWALLWQHADTIYYTAQKTTVNCLGDSAPKCVREFIEKEMSELGIATPTNVEEIPDDYFLTKAFPTMLFLNNVTTYYASQDDNILISSNGCRELEKLINQEILNQEEQDRLAQHRFCIRLQVQAVTKHANSTLLLRSYIAPICTFLLSWYVAQKFQEVFPGTPAYKFWRLLGTFTASYTLIVATLKALGYFHDRQQAELMKIVDPQGLHPEILQAGITLFRDLKKQLDYRVSTLIGIEDKNSFNYYIKTLKMLLKKNYVA